MTLAAAPIPTQTTVGMGQIAVGTKDDRLTAVLGSCVGVVLFHPRLSAAALAHVVLPASNGRDGAPGKFADTAITAMITELARLGINRAGLAAKLTGGACMFGAGGPMQIGDANITATREALAAAGIPIVAQDVGGRVGRRITVTCGDGRVTIECVSQSPRTI